MSAPLRSGDLKDARLVDVFDACCRGGQATVVRVFLGPPGAIDMQGAAFFEGGEITDAHLEDSEGLEALRRMLGHLQGRYEVEVGPRSVRRTIDQPWPSIAASLGITPAKPGPPALRAVETPRTPPPAPQVSAPRPVPPPPPQTGERPAVPRPVSPIHPPAAPRGPATAVATARRPDTGEVPVNAISGPRASPPSGPRTRPPTGPHATGESSGRHTAPFSSIRHQGRQSPAMRTGLLALLAIVVGGGLA